ncbi:MAG: hypothetical protein IPJ60_00630 [Sphingobacteriaceae bacterium]|nr:hypothetical protein [Sphingobacteriaceae bacterium]
MNTATYFIIALLWIAACSFISLYILGMGMTLKQQVSLGFKSILVSFLLGACMLFLMIAIDA